ncbi:MauE/DoxX family redox-associated membrane protein [Streptomyces acidiscabies]|uniref:MauE/DoxX family redox-associated membrane protein n=1 Tax=Streptomyces acidiscabies TaxID=42234 RepID=UPI0030D5F23C
MTLFISEVLRLTLGMVLLSAGAAKLHPRADTQTGIRRYGLLPDRLVAPAARCLPSLELAVGALLCAGTATRAAAVAAAALFSGFAMAGAASLVRGRRIPCGCHGVLGEAPVSWPLVARTCTLAAAAVAVALHRGDLSLPDTVAAVAVTASVLCAVRVMTVVAGFRRQHHRVTDAIRRTAV